MHTCTIENGQRIYHHPTHRRVDVPHLDLLTFLFDSEHTAAQSEDLILHRESDDPSNILTKSRLRSTVQRIAHSLRHHHSIGSHGPNKDTVTVITHGQILIPALFFGIIAAGGVYSAASPSSTVSELARQVKIAESRVIVCGSEHVDVAKKAAMECGLGEEDVLVLESGKGKWGMRNIAGSGQELLSEDGEELSWERASDPKALRESLICILWSSGTTGLPKGVMLSHANLVTETYVIALAGRELAAREMEKETFQPVDFQTLAHLPTSHIAGLFGYLISPFYNGGTVNWMRKYEWNKLLKGLKRHKITVFYTVPSIWLRISKSKEVTDHFQYLEGASTGAAPMDSQLQRSANSRLTDGKSTFIGQTWGLSETTGAVTAPVKESPDDTGCIGYVLPRVELRVVDEDYKDVAEGQEGELLIRSPLVTNGYYDNPEATMAAFHGEWFCSGDIGVCRDGKFYVVDRKKELLKFKGQQIAPAEIENLLFTHSQIREAAIVGVPAPEDPGTDWPRAYVVPVDRSKISEEEVKEYVKARLAPYKQLRGGVVFVDEIPKNAIGKFLRRQLRDRARKEIRMAKL